MSIFNTRKNNINDTFASFEYRSNLYRDIADRENTREQLAFNKKWNRRATLVLVSMFFAYVLAHVLFFNVI